MKIRFFLFQVNLTMLTTMGNRQNADLHVKTRFDMKYSENFDQETFIFAVRLIPCL